jgi:hypothetical protein
VSKPLKLLQPRGVVVTRLRSAAAAMADALAHDDDEQAVQSAIARVFRHYVDAPATDALAGAAALLRRPAPVSSVALGLAGPAVTIPSTRAYGGRRLP